MIIRGRQRNALQKEIFSTCSALHLSVDKLRSILFYIAAQGNYKKAQWRENWEHSGGAAEQVDPLCATPKTPDQPSTHLNPSSSLLSSLEQHPDVT